MIASNVHTVETNTVEKNEKILLRRYPLYAANVEKFIESGAMEKLKDFLIGSYMQHGAARRKAIMILLHTNITQDIIGGTEFYIKEMVRDLAQNYIFYVLSPEGQGITVTIFLDGAQFSRQWVSKDFGELLDLIHPSIIHINHTKDAPSELLEAILQSPAPKIYTVHDYYSLCKHYALLDSTNHFCEVPDTARCAACAKILFPNQPNAPFRQRRFAKDIIDNAACVIFPTEAARAIFQRGVHIDDAQTRIIPNPDIYPIRADAGKSILARQKYKEFAEQLQQLPAEYLRVGVIGYNSPLKGSNLSQNIVSQMSQDKVVFISFGEMTQHIKRSHLLQTGKYQRDEIIDLIRESKVDVMLLLSPWPETFSYTLSETWMAGVPAIVSPYGAFTERVQQTGAGIVASEYTAMEFIKIIRSIISNRDMLIPLRESVRIAPHENSYARLLDVYQEFATEQIPIAPPRFWGASLQFAPIVHYTPIRSPFIKSLVQLRLRLIPIRSRREKIYQLGLKIFAKAVRYVFKNRKARNTEVSQNYL